MKHIKNSHRSMSWKGKKTRGIFRNFKNSIKFSWSNQDIFLAKNNSSSSFVASKRPFRVFFYHNNKKAFHFVEPVSFNKRDDGDIFFLNNNASSIFRKLKMNWKIKYWHFKEYLTILSESFLLLRLLRCYGSEVVTKVLNFCFLVIEVK